MSEDIKAKVQQLRDAELKLEGDLAAATAALGTAREREAAAVLASALDGASGRKTGESAVAITERVAALTAAIGQAREQRVEAIKATWVAEAAEVRAQATAKHAEADAHAAKVAELLRPLQELEGVGYMPDPRVWMPWLSPEGRAVDPHRHVTPRGQRMRGEAVATEQLAVQVEQREVSTRGSVDAPTRDDLVTIVRNVDPSSLGPTLHELLAWLDREEATLRAKIDRLSNDFLRTEARDQIEFTYALTWRDGQLVERESSIRASRRQPYVLKGSGQVVEETVAVA